MELARPENNVKEPNIESECYRSVTGVNDDKSVESGVSVPESNGQDDKVSHQNMMDNNNLKKQYTYVHLEEA